MLRNISLPKYLRRPEGCVAKQSDNTYEFRTYVGGDQKAGKFYVSLFYEEKIIIHFYMLVDYTLMTRN